MSQPTEGHSATRASSWHTRPREGPQKHGTRRRPPGPGGLGPRDELPRVSSSEEAKLLPAWEQASSRRWEGATALLQSEAGTLHLLAEMLSDGTPGCTGRWHAGTWEAVEAEAPGGLMRPCLPWPQPQERRRGTGGAGPVPCRRGTVSLESAGQGRGLLRERRSAELSQEVLEALRATAPPGADGPAGRREQQQPHCGRPGSSHA